MLLRTRFGGAALAAQGGSLASKLLLSVALLGSAAGVAGLGTYATFTSSTPAESQALAAGTTSIQLGQDGTSSNRLDVGATGIAPGDTIQRSVDLSSVGNVGLAAITLTTSASPSSALDTDTTNGLQLAIDSCSGAWTESSGPPYTYTCPGTTQTVLAQRPVIGADMALSNLTSLTAGSTDHLRVTLTLPTTADNSFQGLSSGIGFVFTGTQRAGTSR